MIDLPKLTGTYALALRLDSPQRFLAGRLGEFNAPAGEYVYTGSAFGPGGLRARLQRHLAGDGALHWHIDYLRRIARPIWFAYSPAARRLECDWSQRLNALPGACAPIPGFGASDCRAGCPAHLIAVPGPNLEPAPIIDALQNVSGSTQVHFAAV